MTAAGTSYREKNTNNFVCTDHLTFYTLAGYLGIFNTTLLDKHASKVRLFSKNYFENLEYWYHYFIFLKKSTVYLWGFKKSSRGWGRKEVKRVRASVQLSLKCTHIPKLIPQQAIYTHPYVYFCLSHFPFCVVFTLPHIISIFLFLSPDKIF